MCLPRWDSSMVQLASAIHSASSSTIATICRSGIPRGALGLLANGWNVSGVTTIQDGTPLTITDQNGGTVYDIGTYDTARAQMCPGSTYGSIATSGGITNPGWAVDAGGSGYLNNSAFCPEPAAPNSVAAALTAFPPCSANSGVGHYSWPGQFQLRYLPGEDHAHHGAAIGDIPSGVL